MKRILTIYCCIVIIFTFVLTGCNRNKKGADIPDIESIYSNINYLDSLSQSSQRDSIEQVHNYLIARIRLYTNRAETPEDKAIIDSLVAISNVVNDFLQFCTETNQNLEIFQQDVKDTESQYISGKMKKLVYVSTLMEQEQSLIEIDYQLSAKCNLAKQYLKVQPILIQKLSPLPLPMN